MDATSLEVRKGATTGAVVQALREALGRVKQPSAALLFCSGGVAGRALAVAQELAGTLPPSLPLLVICGSGVLSERGEVEGESAATGLVLGGGSPRLRVSSREPIDTQALLEQLSWHEPDGTELLFMRSEGFRPEELWRARAQLGESLVFGAATHGEPGLVVVHGGRASKVSLASLRLDGFSRPVVKTAHSCRLLHPLMRISRAEGTRVLELDGEPALGRLQAIGSRVEGKPLLFTVLAESADDGPVDLLVRGIQGIDSDRRALLVGSEVTAGMYLTFGVKDAPAARRALEAGCRSLRRELGGAAPCFALYFNCSGRGRGLYGTHDVDTRVLREGLPRVPIAGFFSAFEIAPFEQKPALQLYTGVLAVFSAPS